MIQPADLQAVGDVLDDVTNEADTYEVEHAIDVMHSIDDVISQARRAKEMVVTQLKNRLENGTVHRKGRVYIRKASGKWRFDHGTIGRVIAKSAVIDRETGEMLSPEEAAQQAVRLCMMAWVTPSDTVTVGALNALHIPKQDVAEWHKDGTYIKVEEVDG